MSNTAFCSSGQSHGRRYRLGAYRAGLLLVAAVFTISCGPESGTPSATGGGTASATGGGSAGGTGGGIAGATGGGAGETGGGAGETGGGAGETGGGAGDTGGGAGDTGGGNAGGIDGGTAGGAGGGAASTTAVLVGAGDIAHGGTADDATAKLLDGISGTVFTAGDNVYENGTVTEFSKYYAPSWGRHKARTYPSAGNHDYGTAGAAGYFGYFGNRAGDPTKGYYSYDLGAWHIVVINSNCSSVGGCGAGSKQEKWLRADLAANTKKCTLSYWHHPRFNSGAKHGSSTSMTDIWKALYEFGAEIVVSGHDHLYERFSPQTPMGVADANKGITQFVVGTGGAGLYGFGTPLPNSVVRYNGGHGVIKFTLQATKADFQFISVAGKTFTDKGSVACH